MSSNRQNAHPAQVFLWIASGLGIICGGIWTAFVYFDNKIWTDGRDHVSPTPSPPVVLHFSPTPPNNTLVSTPSPSIIESPTPSPPEYETRFIGIVSRVLKISANEVKLDHRLTSAERLEIMAAVRQNFALTDSAKEFGQLETVGDVLALIRSKDRGSKQP